MSLKTSHDDTEELVSRFVRHAGYTRPTPLQSAAVPIVLLGRDLLIEAAHGDGKTGAMILPLLVALTGRQGPEVKALILTGSSEQVLKIENQFKLFAPRSGHRPTLATVGHEEQARRELRLLKKHTDILVGTPDRVIDHIRRDNLSLSEVEYAILDIPDDVNEHGFDKDVQFIYSKMRGVVQTVGFLHRLDSAAAFESILRRPQTLLRADWVREDTVESTREEEGMSDKERFDGAISALVKRAKENENPEVLNHFRKLYRKSIPLHLRGYISAMLLKDYLGGEAIASEQTKTIFVSIGKNRRVYPKDLTKLFSDTLGIDQSSLSNVKVLDSYSFIEVPESHADRAIELLNDTEFRGRAMTVNHAKKKRR